MTLGDPTTTAPVVVNYSPQNNAPNVPLNVVLDVGYSEALSAATVNTTDVLLQDPNSQTVTATVTLHSTGTVIHLVPSAALTARTQYCFSVQNVQGTNGQAAQSQSNCFMTGGAQTTAPTVVAVSPADKLVNVPVNANISVLFSEPIDPLTVDGTTIQVTRTWPAARLRPGPCGNGRSPCR